jgi:hypothetical protein
MLDVKHPLLSIQQSMEQTKGVGISLYIIFFIILILSLTFDIYFTLKSMQNNGDYLNLFYGSLENISYYIRSLFCVAVYKSLVIDPANSKPALEPRGRAMDHKAHIESIDLVGFDAEGYVLKWHLVSSTRDKKKWDIGRGKNCEIQISDSSVSRVHASIRTLDGRFWISDLQSTNGTRINGVILRHGEERLLSIGDTLDLGIITLEVVG